MAQLKKIIFGSRQERFMPTDAHTPQQLSLNGPGTCKLNGINPFIWLRETLRRIAAHPINKIEELLPQNFKLNDNP